jgi:eukaryotic-like serine/threonine-protein kinase
MRDQPLFDAAGRIADGEAVDWAAVTGTTSSDQERILVDELELVARVAAGHRRLHDLLPESHRPDFDRARWGHLDLLNVVGQGSYGTVYRAWDPRLERLVALKLFHRSPHPEIVMREGRMLARVRHENVVSVYGADVVDGVAGLWMEFVHGQTLDQIIKTSGPIAARDAATVGLHVARALGAIHAAHVLHCDVKAQNVVREATGRVVLMDLGAGRPVPEAAEFGAEVTGTPLYMAPELFQPGAMATSATDVYALGVLLYYLTTGRFPIIGQSYRELKDAHLNGRIQLLTAGPPALVAIVNRTLDPDPAERPESPQVMERALLPLASPHRVKAGIWWVAIVAVGLLVTGVWRFNGHETVATPTAPAIRSIAVLPIKNLTGDDKKRYLADGLTEVLISNVARVRGFRVPSATAVAGLAKDDAVVAPLAASLGVDFILAGSITQADDQFRMAVRLVDPKTNIAIWGEEIIREPPGILSAQADIARFVAERLAMTLGPEEQKALRGHQTDPRALEAYLRGTAARGIPTAAPRREAARYFKLATEIDPSFALAWADLALVEVALHNDQPLLARMERSALIRSMAERAIYLDPTEAGGYAALGTVLFYDAWDFPSAEAAFRHALLVNPSHAFTRQRYAMLLAAQARLPEAIAIAREATQIEPQSEWRALGLSGVYYYAREYDKAEAEARRALELAPNFPVPLFTLGQIAAARGRYDDAIKLVRAALAGSDFAGWHAELARMTAAAGRADEVKTLVASLERRRRAGDGASPDNRAYLAIAEGRIDDAFAILGDAIEKRLQNVLWLAVDPRVDALRADQRFAPLLAKIGLR